MTNQEAWQFYMKNNPAPQDFIDSGFYFMISSALQRRVWLGHPQMPLFPNLYVVLVADPGVGKGITLKPVISCLRSLKIKQESDETPQDDSDLDVAFKMRSAMSRIKKQHDTYLLPTAADCVTYEALVAEHAKKISTYVTKPCEMTNGKPFYFYNSIYVALEEMGTFFRKNVENLLMYLITAFDSGDYRHTTKTQGESIIHNCCLSLIAGTTPGFLYRAMDDSFINEGFSARTLFVYAARNRFNKFKISDFTPEQTIAKTQIETHLRKLTTLFGQVSFSNEAEKFLEYYVENTLPTISLKARPELKPYFARKSIHLQKLAVCEHFSEEHKSMEISLATVEKAFNFLNKIESKMHIALNLRKRNPLSNVASSILEYVRANPGIDKAGLYVQYYDTANANEIKETLSFLQSTNQLGVNEGKYYAKNDE